MKVARERFIEQFGISIMVIALKHWRRRSKTPPEYVAHATWNAITVCNGGVPIGLTDFRKIVEPVVSDLHRTIPQTERPEFKAFTGLVYDALSAAGIEITIRPPAQPHGGGYGRRQTP